MKVLSEQKEKDYEGWQKRTKMGITSGDEIRNFREATRAEMI